MSESKTVPLMPPCAEAFAELSTSRPSARMRDIREPQVGIEPTTARFILAGFLSPQSYFPLWRCRDHDRADPQFASKRRGKCPESVRATGGIPTGSYGTSGHTTSGLGTGPCPPAIHHGTTGSAWSASATTRRHSATRGAATLCDPTPAFQRLHHIWIAAPPRPAIVWRTTAVPTDTNTDTIPDSSCQAVLRAKWLDLVRVGAVWPHLWHLLAQSMLAEEYWTKTL